ncbi:hypothetical protein BBBOND_0209410 [Babesia bigemina]|uniref:Uncharacterized protein n=1 Tax=Babesia bigemina TaxID=5866 RepID=A0A061D5H4_BABBI|nr:hypothetical protein BBBOND_0209410 [Babesia bigemina]CDR95788.1 hypothetical protein BBBOND_0209410 [Babesia bigemina]|eukprot:XP_012767974.1 hypothetical protein BBBOND_0209410 [Babesia bigemina]
MAYATRAMLSGRNMTSRDRMIGIMKLPRGVTGRMGEYTRGQRYFIPSKSLIRPPKGIPKLLKTFFTVHSVGVICLPRSLI